MKERLQKILSARGVTSRRKAEEWILAGRVQVDGRVAGLGDQADPPFRSLPWMAGLCRRPGSWCTSC